MIEFTNEELTMIYGALVDRDSGFGGIATDIANKIAATGVIAEDILKFNAR